MMDKKVDESGKWVNTPVRKEGKGKKITHEGRDKREKTACRQRRGRREENEVY